MSYESTTELLERIPGNSENLAKLTAQIATPTGILPFVGAGISASFGLPLWPEFLRVLAEAAGLQKEIEKRLSATPAEYEEAARDLLQALQPRHFQDLMAAHYGDHVIADKRLVGAVTELTRFPPGPIATTNFDRVLEMAFQQAGKQLTPYWHSHASKGSEALQQNKPFLLKLHGDWEDQKSRILTLEEYEAAYGDVTANKISFERPIPTLLFSLLSSRCCLFLGCSLQQDRTIRLLNTIGQSVPDLVHYAVVEQPATAAEIPQRVAGFGQTIRPIWYPHGEHGLIQPLLAYLAARAAENRSAESISSETISRHATPPNNIPDPGNILVGRGPEIFQVTKMLPAARCVTITGAGGCGKSRLAIEVAAAVKHEYKDGVWFVALADFAKKADKERVLPTQIGKLVGVPEQAGRPPHEALAEHFGTGKYLIVLDNCEHLIHSCRDLLEYLLRHCPKLTILATSRRPLKMPQERLYPLAPLEPPSLDAGVGQIRSNPAITLFLERAKERSPEFKSGDSALQDIAALCRILDGIPLAIEVAVARLGVMSIAEMKRESRNLLNVIGNIRGGDLRRWKTLGLALKWSYSLLDADQQAFIRSLTIFDGGWTAKAAAAVWAEHDPGAAVWDHLQALHENSLVISTEIDGVKRFRFLEPIRQVVQQQMRPEERILCEQRHAKFFLQLSEQAAPELVKSEQAAWLDALQIEFDNFRAVFRRAVATADAETGLRLVASLWRFLEIRGYLTEGRERAEAVLKISGQGISPQYQSAALTGAGMLAYRQADFDAAERRFREALQFEEALDNKAGIANSLCDLGNIANRRQDRTAARKLFERSLDLYAEIKDRRGIGVISFNLGTIAGDSGDYDEATRFMNESLRYFREDGNDRESGFPLNALAQISIAMGNQDLAEDWAGQSLSARQKVKDSKGIADSLRTLGWVSIEMKATEKARERLSQSLILSEGLGDSRGISESLQMFGLLHCRLNNLRFALELFAAAGKLQRNFSYESQFLAKERALAMDSAKRDLGEQEYANAWRRGSLLTATQAIEAALQPLDGSASSATSIRAG